MLDRTPNPQKRSVPIFVGASLRGRPLLPNLGRPRSDAPTISSNWNTTHRGIQSTTCRLQSPAVDKLSLYSKLRQRTLRSELYCAAIQDTGKRVSLPKLPEE